MHIRDGLARTGREDIDAMHIMVLLERQLRKVGERGGQGELEKGEGTSSTASAAAG
jgi:hypothetical protein